MSKQVVIKKTTVLPITVQGAIMEKARKLYGDNAQIQPADIRVEHVLSNGNVSHTFNLNGNGVNQRPTETFLGRNDLFIMYAMMVGLQKVDTSKDNPSSGNYQTYPYPDKFVFDVAATATNVSESDALFSIFNGSIGMKANSYELINETRLQRFLYIPETQASATTMSQVNDQAWLYFEQPAILSGRDTNLLSFLQAEGADTVQIGGDVDEENILVFHMLGLVVRNGAQAATWEELGAEEYAAYLERVREMTIDGKLLK